MVAGVTRARISFESDERFASLRRELASRASG